MGEGDGNGGEGAGRAERVPGKALGCNFSRYIRDGSRNERRKDPSQAGREKRATESEGKKAAREFPSVARTTSVPDGGTLDYSQGIFQLSKFLRRFPPYRARARSRVAARLREFRCETARRR